MYVEYIEKVDKFLAFSERKFWETWHGKKEFDFSLNDWKKRKIILNFSFDK